MESRTGSAPRAKLQTRLRGPSWMKQRVPAVDFNHRLAIEAAGGYTQEDFTLIGIRIHRAHRPALQTFLKFVHFENMRQSLPRRHLAMQVDEDPERFRARIREPAPWHRYFLTRNTATSARKFCSAEIRRCPARQ